MSILGIEAAIHIFFALLALLSASALLALLLDKSKNKKLILWLSIAVAVFVWLSWFTVIHVYTLGYAPDKGVIIKHPEIAMAHEVGMETKEHIFYTGLILATLLPIFAYVLDIESPNTRKLMLTVVILLILGGLIMESFGGWIASAAKMGWYLESPR